MNFVANCEWQGPQYSNLTSPERSGNSGIHAKRLPQCQPEGYSSLSQVGSFASVSFSWFGVMICLLTLPHVAFEPSCSLLIQDVIQFRLSPAPCTLCGTDVFAELTKVILTVIVVIT